MLDMIKNSDALILSQKLAENYQQIAQKLITKLGTPYSKNQFEKLIKFIICRLN
jgi:geranylgeranyl pyrophosphate synthase